MWRLTQVPAAATVYIAQYGSMRLWVNGVQAGEYAPVGKHFPRFHVSAIEIGRLLHAGTNEVAVEVTSGIGASHTTSNPKIRQLTSGHTLLVSCVAAGAWQPGSTLLSSDTRWEAREAVGDGDWSTAASLGPPDSDVDFLQWNADAGLYAWPGYQGVSPWLRVYTLRPVKVFSTQPQSGVFKGLESLTGKQPAALRVVPSADGATAPSLMVDFGRELNGRLRLESDGSGPEQVDIAYGESEQEALHQPFLGMQRIQLVPHRVAYGPKSAFRYVLLSFPGKASLHRIEAQGITYPVRQQGSFHCSDPKLDRIWETAAYTARLSMQDSIWDAPKRDRARWAGDLDVSGHVIDDVFGDRFLMEDTLRLLVTERTGDVNKIHGYTPLWISSLADFMRHSGDTAFLQEMHKPLLDLVNLMDKEVGDDFLFHPPATGITFVDWSDDLHSDTPEARAATTLLMAMGYRDATFLLGLLHDDAHATHARTQYEHVTTAARQHLYDPHTGAYGGRWQTNALAVLSGAGTPSDAIWSAVLSHASEWTAQTPSITPYYGYYVIEAMARLGHTDEALAWMRTYWGGMLDLGATSFWEAYDPRWPREDFHAQLQADGKKGYYVSLAHAWSSGPAAWLIENIAGIRSVSSGGEALEIQPHLCGLRWAEASMSTAHGAVHVRVRRTQGEERAVVRLPAGVHASVTLENAQAQRPCSDCNATRQLQGPGTFHLSARM